MLHTCRLFGGKLHFLIDQHVWKYCALFCFELVSVWSVLRLVFHYMQWFPYRCCLICFTAIYFLNCIFCIFFFVLGYFGWVCFLSWLTCLKASVIVGVSVVETRFPFVWKCFLWLTWCAFTSGCDAYVFWYVFGISRINWQVVLRVFDSCFNWLEFLWLICLVLYVVVMSAMCFVILSVGVIRDRGALCFAACGFCFFFCGKPSAPWSSNTFCQSGRRRVGPDPAMALHLALCSSLWNRLGPIYKNIRWLTTTPIYEWHVFGHYCCSRIGTSHHEQLEVVNCPLVVCSVQCDVHVACHMQHPQQLFMSVCFFNLFNGIADALLWREYRFDNMCALPLQSRRWTWSGCGQSIQKLIRTSWALWAKWERLRTTPHDWCLWLALYA